MDREKEREREREVEGLTGSIWTIQRDDHCMYSSTAVSSTEVQSDISLTDFLDLRPSLKPQSPPARLVCPVQTVDKVTSKTG